MTTKALFITKMGGSLMPLGDRITFARTSGDICTATAHGLNTGAGPYRAMTTSGTDLPSGMTAAVQSTTFVTGASVIATDALVVGDKTYTFIATPAADGDVDVGASDAATMENLARAINLGAGAGTDYDIDTTNNGSNVTAEARGDTCIITAKTLDATLGDAISTTTADATLTWDAATCEGGADGTAYYIIRLSADTFSVATTKANAEAGTAVALADAGTGVHTLVPTVDTLAEALEDVLVNHLTQPGPRADLAANNIAMFWQSAIDGAVAEET